MSDRYNKIKMLKKKIDEEILTDEETQEIKKEIEKERKELEKEKECKKPKTPPHKEENDKCTEKRIKECEKKGKVCNPLKGTCVDKNGKTYNDYLKTLNKTKTPLKDEIKEPKTPPIKELKNNIYDENLSQDECNVWFKNKLRNPRTNILIEKNKQLYNEIEKQCEKYQQKNMPSIYAKKLTETECEKWFKNDLINPRTNAPIHKNEVIYNQIKKQCDEYKLKNVDIEPKPSPKPSPESSPIPSPIHSPIPSPKVIDNDLYYPDLNDKYFREKLNNLYEFNIHKITDNKIIKDKREFDLNTTKLCGEFEKTYYQHFVSHYISSRTPYKSLMLYHGVGVGKTCSAITLSENLLLTHAQYDEPKIWVIMPSALRGSFRDQVFSLSNFNDFKLLTNQCTGDTYVKMTQLLKSGDKDKALFKVKKFINSRYRLFTYDEFAKMIENEYENKILKDKIIIIDEAHNIRNSAKLEEKRIYSAILKAITTGINNKLILLTATPMYNEPSDILDLLYLFLLNDKRDEILAYVKPPFENLFDKTGKINKTYENILKTLAGNYISYLRGVNPFTFAVKLKPSQSGYDIMTKEIKNDPNNNKIPESDENWLDKMNDEIVLSKLSNKQLAMIETKKELSENNVLATLQPMNIVYDNKTGVNGFTSFFNRVDTTGSLKLNYNKKYENALFPTKENLGLYSGKFLTIANTVKKSEGIVIIYSRFVEGGILPLALILEHMGYNREGEKNILNKPKIIDNAPKYNYKSAPKYCIMTSHSELNNVMGSSSIDKLIPIINNPKNINGELVKVILMTPVASEGLSFYNARELHIVEPWYHFNKAKQIIGRGIRNCRHNSLPIEKRNMTVFMHASFNNYSMETPDIHAYRISSKKMYQTDILDKIIRDNAIDCYLMKNINYFDKKIFDFKLEIETSQNKKILYNYGDDDDIKPICNLNITNNKQGFRKETYNHLVMNVKKIIKSLVINKIQNGDRYLKFDEIIKEANQDENIIFEAINDSVFPNNILDEYILLVHNDGIHIIDKGNHKYNKINIIKNNEIVIKPDVSQNDSILPDYFKLEESEEYTNIISIYLSFDSNIYEKFVKYVITTPYSKINENYKYIAECLFKEGALVHKKELKGDYDDDIKYIGYFNIYSDDLDINIYNYSNKTFKTLSDIDKDYLSIIEKRRKIEIPDMQKETLSVGLIIPKKTKNIYNNTFKILSIGKAYGKKTGIVCESLLKPDQDVIISQYGLDITKTKKKITKEKTCKLIAENMLKLNKLYIYPYYKPIIN